MNRLKTIFSLLALVSLSLGNCKPINDDEKISDLFLYYLLFQALANATEENCSFSPSSSDALYNDEWHLRNVGQLGGTVGEDANVSPVWNQDISGNRVIVSVVDDGLDIRHEDLSQNISVTARGLNLLNGTIYPTHSYSNSFHGSAVGGVIAARGGNNLGVRGAAPCSKLVGVNILEKSTIYTSDEYRAMVNESSRVSISNNSWGSPDGYGWLWPSSSLWQQGINEGIRQGKSGKGTVYVWAAGNGANGGTIVAPILVDNANYDGQANFYGVMAIGGIGQNGKKAAYSESGANLWVVAHTQGNSATAYTTAISTTDATGSNGLNVGGSSGDYSLGNYTKKFNGTSSATPLAAGVIALLIGKYPELTWRDVRELVAYSARKNDASDTDWALNTAGLNINHKYGFGAVDAVSLLTKASTWTPITAGLITYTATALSPNTPIPDNDLVTGATVNYTVGSTINYIEYVDVEFTSNHSYFPELSIEITSPSGTKSVLTEPHACVNPYNNSLCSSGNTSIASMTGSSTYRFGLARHLGENPNGIWVLKVFDSSATDTGQINSVQLRIYGR
ncbi:convertase P-domain protein [Leptospira wolbachii serovar Codice str. CDC]|uniref:Convertase P-domain protein n=1 Tax=Leptospira wolbachii serovar Codice str. CDC TaxID=1218599 RepID=R9A2S0_9LEPT|nr:S8 family serine peptidase [Leptospira wolbachii]EOQ96526.1 convertase P-domain protein [Leptospira wolbachii serovar Codice str. CDC]